MPGRIETPSAQLGQLLLRGWCMLAEACDDCQLPLMRDPATMRSHCVGCRRVFDSEGREVSDDGAPLSPQAPPPAAAAASASPAAAAPAAAAAAPASPAATPAAAAAAASSPGPAQPPASASPSPPRPRMNGPLLAAAPGQPAAAQPSARAAAAPAAPAAPSLARGPRPGPAAPGEGAAAGGQPRQPGQRAAAGAAAPGGRPDPSELLADKLLHGWALLSEHCPLCSTPLMRTRAREVRCVVCDLPVLMEGQGQAAAPEPAAAALPATGPAAPAAAAEPPQPPQLASVPVPLQGNGVASGGSLAPPTALAAAAAAAVLPRSGGPAAAALSGAQLAMQQHQVLQGLQQALLAKLDEARAQLAATPAARPEALCEQLQLAEQLLRTLAAVKGAQ